MSQQQHLTITDIDVAERILLRECDTLPPYVIRFMAQCARSEIRAQETCRP